MTWIGTFTGLAFDFDDVDHSPISIADIAQALSQICRYTGHTTVHYSVAQHSILVAREVERWAIDAGLDRDRVRRAFLAALVHDAAEAYVGDVSRPLKHWLRRRTTAYDEIEALVQARIESALEIGEVEPEVREAIRRADAAMLPTEKRSFMARAPFSPAWDSTTETIEPMPADVACVAWLSEFRASSCSRGRFAVLASGA